MSVVKINNNLVVDSVNVGIGESNPQNKLDVSGGIVIGATYSGTNTAPENGASIEGKLGVGTSTVDTNVKAHILKSGTAMAGDGNTTLFVQNSASAGTGNALALISGASGKNYIFFGDTTNFDEGLIWYDNSNDSMAFYTNEAHAITIDSSQKVGIDTSTPNATLTINGSQSIKRTDAGAADYNPSALTTDYLITANNTAAARAITISSEDVAAGTTANPRVFVVKDEYGSASTYNLTVTLEGGGTIDGAASAVISSDNDSITLYCTGTNAFTIT